MERKLNAAEKLLSGLGREEVRWTKDEAELAQKIINLTGDCLTTSAFLCYSGPFDGHYVLILNCKQSIGLRRSMILVQPALKHSNH